MHPRGKVAGRRSRKTIRAPPLTEFATIPKRRSLSYIELATLPLASLRASRRPPDMAHGFSGDCTARRARWPRVMLAYVGIQAARTIETRFSRSWLLAEVSIAGCRGRLRQGVRQSAAVRQSHWQALPALGMAPAGCGVHFQVSSRWSLGCATVDLHDDRRAELYDRRHRTVIDVSRETSACRSLNQPNPKRPPITRAARQSCHATDVRMSSCPYRCRWPS